jgi:hypothetical protein
MFTIPDSGLRATQTHRTVSHRQGKKTRKTNHHRKKKKAKRKSSFFLSLCHRASGSAPRVAARRHRFGVCAVDAAR